MWCPQHFLEAEQTSSAIFLVSTVTVGIAFVTVFLIAIIIKNKI